jgi:hypothetical protein
MIDDIDNQEAIDSRSVPSEDRREAQIEGEIMSGRAANAFDPSSYMRQLRGRSGPQDYLDVRYRVLWLRRDHPNAEIVTEHVRIDDTIAIFKATVTLPDGGKATGYGSETTGDFPDYIEKAETKALGRALNALGFGAQFVEAEDEDQSQVRPVPPRPASGRPQASASGSGGGAPAPTPLRPEQASTRAAAPRSQPSAKRQETSDASSDEGGEADLNLEDFSWTAFWRWAREQGYESKGGIEAFIERPLKNLNPAEIRQLIIDKRGAEA